MPASSSRIGRTSYGGEHWREGPKVEYSPREATRADPGDSALVTTYQCRLYQILTYDYAFVRTREFRPKVDAAEGADSRTSEVTERQWGSEAVGPRGGPRREERRQTRGRSK
ncbi:hypothetical protein DBV15_07098 [Temnothorax longispinosus]|uniref:Uncharacterized protein n=1 Tax=Temnothorax longispinosus TaxID=300112 RepID=A0A4V3SBE4_9HYME|nr:hypothetical protein DBV15_07098 [Temnothorax longispinosus]